MKKYKLVYNKNNISLYDNKQEKYLTKEEIKEINPPKYVMDGIKKWMEYNRENREK